MLRQILTWRVTVSPDIVKWQLSVSKSVQGIVTDKSWKGIVLTFVKLSFFLNLNVTIDELYGQVCFLYEAVDRPDVESNIAQGNCAVHGKLEISKVRNQNTNIYTNCHKRHLV